MMPIGPRVVSLGDLLKGTQEPEPAYANQVEIIANPAEFRLAFGVVHVVYPRTMVGIIIMTPIVTKALSEMLVKNVQKWEAQYGHITLPEEADKLVKGLFGMGGPTKADEHQSDREGPEDQKNPDGDS